MRLRLLALAFLPLLAGCLGGAQGPEPEAGPTTAATAATTGPGAPPPAPPAVPLTDTLHFLEAPHMSGRVPTAPEPIRQALPSAYADLTGASLLEWRLPRPAAPAVTGEVTLWVDVQGTVVNAGYAQAGGCFWILWIAVESEDGGQPAEIGACLIELPVVPTGVRQLRFQLPTLETAGVEGPRLVLGLQTTAAPSSTGTVDVLAGSFDRASAARIDGLQVPVDTETLL